MTGVYNLEKKQKYGNKMNQKKTLHFKTFKKKI